MRDRTPTSIAMVLIEGRFGITLLLGTVLGGPVLLAALNGERSVASALFFYALALVVAWFVIGFMVAAFSSPGPISDDNDERQDSGRSIIDQ